jgi:hypothetical protein
MRHDVRKAWYCGRESPPVEAAKFPVPELTRSASIQLNERVSLRRGVVALLASQMHVETEKLLDRLAALAEARARFVALLSELASLREQIVRAELWARGPRGRYLH